MNRRYLFSLLAVAALIVVIGAQSAWAGRIRQHRRHAPRWKAAVQTRISQSNSLAIRRADGKTLWDLGKQQGQWPSLP